MRFLYTDEMNAFILEHREGLDLYKVVRLFNDRFGTQVTVSAMRSKYKALGIRVGVRRTSYTEIWPREVVAFIREHNAGLSVKDLTVLLNATFSGSWTENQVRAFRKNHNLPSGLDTRFKKGCIPWSAGKSIEEICRTPEALERVRGTHYRKGHSPHNHVPVGTEIVREGYTWIKTGEPNHWRAKHRIIWEQMHGEKLDRDDVVIFLDGNTQNMAPDNLAKISRSENSVINRWELRSTDPDLTRTGVAVARLYTAIRNREEKNDEGEPAGPEQPAV